MKIFSETDLKGGLKFRCNKGGIKREILRDD